VFSSRAEDRMPNPQVTNPAIIRQVVTAPAVGDLPPLAQYLAGDRLAPAEGVRIASRPLPDGYELDLAIPLPLLLVDNGAKAFLIEVVINTTLGIHRRASLFGSPAPYANNIAFTKIVAE